MKWKYSLLDTLLPLTSSQIDVLISLVRRSDEKTGYVRGIFYLDVVKDTGSCIQTFYNSLRALKEHGIIEVGRETKVDYDVHICGNEYLKQDHQQYSEERYVNFNDDVFYMKAFKNLKAHEKYLFLYFYQFTFRTDEGKTMIREKKLFYQDMTKKLQVTPAVLRKYLHQLKLFYSIGTVKGNLLITRKKILRKKSQKGKTEEQWMLEQYVISQCHRLHIKYDKKAVKGLLTLLKSKRNHFIRNGTMVAVGKMLSCIEKSVQGYRPKDRELNGGFVNKLFCASILVSGHDENPDYDMIYKENKLGLCF